MLLYFLIRNHLERKNLKVRRDELERKEAELKKIEAEANQLIAEAKDTIDTAMEYLELCGYTKKEIERMIMKSKLTIVK